MAPVKAAGGRRYARTHARTHTTHTHNLFHPPSPAMINVVVVGAGGSGKSALCIRFCNGVYVDRYDPTIEDTYRRQVEVDRQSVMIEVTDTAGQSQYEECTQCSLALASCVIVAVASDSEASYCMANRFIHLARNARITPSLCLGTSASSNNSNSNGTEEAEESTVAIHQPPIIVVRTKSDVARYVVEDRHLEELCRRNDIKTPIMTTSAKTGCGVNEVFVQAVRLSQAYIRDAYSLDSSRNPHAAANDNHAHGRGRRNSLTSSLFTAASALCLSRSDNVDRASDSSSQKSKKDKAATTTGGAATATITTLTTISEPVLCHTVIDPGDDMLLPSSSVSLNQQCQSGQKRTGCVLV